MNQSVAPTSFITSTSRRRENSDRRIVFEIEQDRRDDEQDREQAGRELHDARGDEDLLRVVACEFLTASIEGSIVVRAAARRRRRERVAQR